MNAAGLQNCF